MDENGTNNEETIEEDGQEPTVVVRKMPAQHWDHVKWICDDATTMAEIAQRLRGAADYFEGLAKQDATLVQPVDGGHIAYLVPGHDVEVHVEVHADGEECPDEDEMFEPCPACHERVSVGDETPA